MIVNRFPALKSVFRIGPKCTILLTVILIVPGLFGINYTFDYTYAGVKMFWKLHFFEAF